MRMIKHFVLAHHVSLSTCRCCNGLHARRPTKGSHREMMAKAEVWRMG